MKVNGPIFHSDFVWTCTYIRLLLSPSHALLALQECIIGLIACSKQSFLGIQITSKQSDVTSSFLLLFVWDGHKCRFLHVLPIVSLLLITSVVFCHLTSECEIFASEIWRLCYCVPSEISDRLTRLKKMTSRTLIMSQSPLFKIKYPRRKEEEVICLSPILT